MKILHISNPKDPARRLEIDLLEQAGFEVRAARDFGEADDWVCDATSPFPYDIVVCAHTLEDAGDGLEYLKNLTGIRSLEHVKFILYTHEPESKIRCDLASHRIEYLHKRNPHLLVRFMNAVAPQARMLERM